MQYVNDASKPAASDGSSVRSSSTNEGGTKKSASSASTHSVPIPVSVSPKFHCSACVVNGRSKTRTFGNCLAIACVVSELPLSTTTTSSAHDKALNVRPMFASSL